MYKLVNFTDWNCHAITSLISNLHFIWIDQLPCDASLFESCINPWLDPFVSDLLVFCYCLCCFDYHIAFSFIFRVPVPMLLNRSPSASSWSSLRGWTSLFRLICRVWSSHTWRGTHPACDWYLQLPLSTLFLQNDPIAYTVFLYQWYIESYQHHM